MSKARRPAIRGKPMQFNTEIDAATQPLSVMADKDRLAANPAPEARIRPAAQQGCLLDRPPQPLPHVNLRVGARAIFYRLDTGHILKRVGLQNGTHSCTIAGTALLSSSLTAVEGVFALFDM